MSSHRKLYLGVSNGHALPCTMSAGCTGLPWQRHSTCFPFAGYCQVTCGTCNCSTTVSQALQQVQANTFLQAAALVGMNAQFDLPGLVATVLAPSDAAFAALLNGRTCWLNGRTMLSHKYACLSHDKGCCKPAQMPCINTMHCNHCAPAGRPQVHCCFGLHSSFLLGHL